VNDLEKKYAEWGFRANAIQQVWDRNTQGGRYPDRMSLNEASALVSDYMSEIGAEIRHTKID
jgi:hypothetical protein